MSAKFKGADLFAGLGGNTEGARMAGVEIVWAGNHWLSACNAHEMNHPDTVHACQDLRQADWSVIPQHWIGLASPSCKGHTHARGKEKPHHDNERATAWAVVDYAECHQTPVILVENVCRFLKWALYPAWELAMQRLGYVLSAHVVDAADHGVPQHRERLFIVCTRSKAPLKLKLPRRDHVPASSFLKDVKCVSMVGSLCANTRRRIKEGRRKFGDRFLVAYYGNEQGGRSVNRPIGTITTVERFGLVDGDRFRMLHVDEYRAAMGFPASYWLPKNKRLAVHLLGNANCPPAVADVLEQIKLSA